MYEGQLVIVRNVTSVLQEIMVCMCKHNQTTRMWLLRGDGGVQGVSACISFIHKSKAIGYKRCWSPDQAKAVDGDVCS